MGVLILHFPTRYGCKTRNKFQQFLLRRNATATQIGSLAADTDEKKPNGRQTNACIESLLKPGGEISRRAAQKAAAPRYGSETPMKKCRRKSIGLTCPTSVGTNMLNCTSQQLPAVHAH